MGHMGNPQPGPYDRVHLVAPVQVPMMEPGPPAANVLLKTAQHLDAINFSIADATNLPMAFDIALVWAHNVAGSSQRWCRISQLAELH